MDLLVTLCISPFFPFGEAGTVHNWILFHVLLNYRFCSNSYHSMASACLFQFSIPLFLPFFLCRQETCSQDIHHTTLSDSRSFCRHFVTFEPLYALSGRETSLWIHCRRGHWTDWCGMRLVIDCAKVTPLWFTARMEEEPGCQAQENATAKRVGRVWKASWHWLLRNLSDPYSYSCVSLPGFVQMNPQRIMKWSSIRQKFPWDRRESRWELRCVILTCLSSLLFVCQDAVGLLIPERFAAHISDLSVLSLPSDTTCIIDQ